MGEVLWNYFLEDFEDIHDVETRKHAISKLPEVAKALGPDLVAQKLVPWIIESSKVASEVQVFGDKTHASTQNQSTGEAKLVSGEHYEVMYLLSEKLGEMSSLAVSGETPLAGLLLDPMFNLLESEEIYVRYKAVESLYITMKELSTRLLCEKVYSLLGKYLKSENYEARESATLLIPALLKQLMKTIQGETSCDSENTQNAALETIAELKKQYRKTCQDAHPSVRMAAARIITFMARLWTSLEVDHELTIEPHINAQLFSGDKKLLFMQSYFFPPRTSSEADPTEKLSRLSINGSALNELQKEKTAMLESLKTDLIKGCLFSLLENKDHYVKQLAMEQFPTTCSYLYQHYTSSTDFDSEEIAQSIVRYISSFAREESWKLRKIIAVQIGMYLETFGAFLMSEVLTLYSELLKDTEGNVRVTAAKQITVVFDATETAAFEQHILPLLPELMAHDYLLSVKDAIIEFTVRDKTLTRLLASQEKEAIYNYFEPIWNTTLRTETVYVSDTKRRVIAGLPQIINALGFDGYFGPKSSWIGILRSIFLASRMKPHELGGAGANDLDATNTSGLSDEVIYPQWRTRAALISAFIQLVRNGALESKAGAGAAKYDMFHELLMEFWLLGCCDDAYVIRRKSVELLVSICESDQQLFQESFLPMVLEFYSVCKKPDPVGKPPPQKPATKTTKKGSPRTLGKASPPKSQPKKESLNSHGAQFLKQLLSNRSGPPRYFLRMVFLQSCAALSQFPVIWPALKDSFILGFTDKVCNVRLEICSLIPRLPREVACELTSNLVDLAKNDSDQDVRNLANTAVDWLTLNTDPL